MLRDFLKQIADTIRAWGNVNHPLNAQDFPIAVTWVFNNGWSVGYEDGFDEGEELGFSAGYNSGMNDCLLSHEMIEEEGVLKGEKAAYDRFWDACQTNGKRTNYSYSFCGAGWNAETFKPKYDIKPTSGYMMFRMFNNGSGKGALDLAEICTRCGIVLDTSSISNGAYLFESAYISRIGEINMTSMGALENTFLNCSWLETIEKLIFKENGSQSWYTAFSNCTALKNINAIEGVIGRDADLSSCPLSKQSIVNVVNALSNTQTTRILMLKKSAVNEAFGIDIDDENTYPQGSEFYTLRHSKDNWTFSYV